MKNPIPDLYQSLSKTQRPGFKDKLISSLKTVFEESYISAILRDRQRRLSPEAARFFHDEINQILSELGVKKRLKLSDIRPDIWGDVPGRRVS